MVNNISNKPVILVFELLLVLLFISTLAFAIPNSLTIQGKLTNLAGSSQQGTFNFTFKIYDASTNGNELWAVINQSVTTDANGIYDVILGGINLSFAEQYYLGIAVQGENESSPRINLTSAPYSFRANTSEALNPNQSYVVRNLSVTGNATIGDGTTLLEISTQRFNFSSTTGNLNINGTVTAKSFVGDGSQLSGISTGQVFNSSGTNVYLNDTNANLALGLSNPSDRLVVIGNVRISGSLNASSINTTGNAYFATSSGNVGVGLTNPYYLLQVASGTDGRSVNLSNVLYVNGSSGNVGIGTTSPNYLLQVASGTDGRSVNLSNVLYVNGSSGNVGIGTTSPKQELDVFDTNADTRVIRVNGTGSDTGIQLVSGSTGGRSYTIYSTGSGSGFGAGKFGIYDDVNGARFTIDSSGNVGIGTTNPAYLLTTDVGTDGRSVNLSGTLYVNSSADTVELQDGTTSQKFRIYRTFTNASNYERLAIQESGGGTGRYNITAEAAGTGAVRGLIIGGDDIIFTRPGVGDSMIISADRYVGIGTSSPGSLLHLSSATPEIRLNDTNNPNWWQVGAVGDDFKIALNDSTTDVLYIDQDGNVGIGTTAPGQTLHVVGTANLTQAVTLANVTIARTVINTTQDNNNNLTISSAAGSVIIRLG